MFKSRTSVSMALVAACMLLQSSCGSGQFSGASKAPGQKAADTGSPAPGSLQTAGAAGTGPASATDASNAGNDGNDGNGGNGSGAGGSVNLSSLASTPDGAVVASCLKEWGVAKFSQKDLDDMRTIDIQADALGGSSSQDDDVTPTTSIILLKVHATTLGRATFTGQNPHGYYCLDADASMLGATVINLACGAKIGNESTSSSMLGGVSVNNECSGSP